jgi:hypothetical protein
MSQITPACRSTCAPSDFQLRYTRAFDSKERSMSPSLRRALRATTFALASLALMGQAPAHDSHADGSSATRAGACKLAMSLARQGVANDRVVNSHCECLETEDDIVAPWSCTAFVTYR